MKEESVIYIPIRTSIYAPTHPNARQGGLMDADRMYAVEVLGKYLSKDTVLHHHKGETFVLCQNKAYHNLLHQRLRAYEETGDAHKRKCIICKQYDLLENLEEHKQNKKYVNYRHKSCRNKEAREHYHKQLTKL